MLVWVSVYSIKMGLPFFKPTSICLQPHRGSPWKFAGNPVITAAQSQLNLAWNRARSQKKKPPTKHSKDTLKILEDNGALWVEGWNFMFFFWWGGWGGWKISCGGWHGMPVRSITFLVRGFPINHIPLLLGKGSYQHFPCFAGMDELGCFFRM